MQLQYQKQNMWKVDSIGPWIYIFRFYSIFVNNTRIVPKDNTVLSRDLSFYNTWTKLRYKLIFTILVVRYFASWNTLINSLPYNFSKTFVSFPFCRNPRKRKKATYTVIHISSHPLALKPYCTYQKTFTKWWCRNLLITYLL